MFFKKKDPISFINIDGYEINKKYIICYYIKQKDMSDRLDNNPWVVVINVLDMEPLIIEFDSKSGAEFFFDDLRYSIGAD